MFARKFALLIVLTVPTLSFAHTPLFSCYDSGDGTVLCEGGFSDGSSASGVEINLFDATNKLVKQTAINEDGEVEFTKPAGEYSVQFNGGPGHAITINGKDIVE